MMVRWMKRDETLKGKKRRQIWRQNRLRRLRNAKYMKIVCFVSMMGTAHCMEMQQLLQQIGQLAEAATQAANAAGAANRMAAASQSKAPAAIGLEAATKILKAPDPYNGDEPIQFNAWKMQFESWLCFGDEKYTNLLSKEERQEAEPDITIYSTEQAAMARKSHAVLSSYLRGRCLHLVRANQESKDGPRLWYQLCKEYWPSTRQRALALAQALSQLPTFNPKVTLPESISQFEQLRAQYETASKQTCPSDLKSGTLIKCAPAKFKGHLQLSLADRSSCAAARETILVYERVSKRFPRADLETVRDPRQIRWPCPHGGGSSL